MQFAFRLPKFPVLFDAGTSLIVARSKEQLASRVARLTLSPGECREIVDASGERFCLFPESMVVAPSISARRWTKMKIIDLYNARRTASAPELRATSLGSRTLAQVVSEAVELLAQHSVGNGSQPR